MKLHSSVSLTVYDFQRDVINERDVSQSAQILMETTLNEITMFCKCCVAMGYNIIISAPLLSSRSSYEMSRIKE